MKKVFERLS